MSHYRNLLKSQNRLRPVLTMSAYQLAWTIVGCAAGAEIGGLVGAVSGILVVELVLILPKLTLIRSVIEFHPWPALDPSLLALAAMLVVAYRLRAVLPAGIAIAVTTVAASLVTIATASTTNREVTGAVLATLHSRRRASPTV